MRRTLVDRIAERCHGLDGDLVDLIWQACARQDMAWMRAQLTERTETDIAGKTPDSPF